MSLSRKGPSKWYVQLRIIGNTFNFMLYSDDITVAGQLERKAKLTIRQMLNEGKTVDECKEIVKLITEESRTLLVHPVEAKPVVNPPVQSATPKQKRKGHLMADVFRRAYDDHFCNLKDGNRSKVQLETILDAAKKVLNDDSPMITDLNASTIMAIQKHILKDKDIESSTLNRYMAALKKTLNMAYKEWELTTGVPFIKMSSEELNARTTVISKDEETTILNHLRSKPKNSARYNDIADLFELLLGSGLRLSEALGLTYSKNIDFTHNCIMLHDRRKIKNKQQRTVPLTDRVRAILEARKVVGNDGVFNLNIHGLEKTFARVKNELNITNPEVCFHACRHTYASRLIEKDVDLYSVKHLLGHKVITTTERYAHMNKSKLQDAVAVLN